MKARSRVFMSVIVCISHAMQKLKNNPPSFMAVYLDRHGKQNAAFKASKKCHQKCVNDPRFVNFFKAIHGVSRVGLYCCDSPSGRCHGPDTLVCLLFLSCVLNFKKMEMEVWKLIIVSSHWQELEGSMPTEKP